MALWLSIIELLSAQNVFQLMPCTYTCMVVHVLPACVHMLQTDGGDGAEGEIAQRTRSKRPLHDVSITSLEAALAAVEGEDPPTPRELDPDELWWHQWLSGLTCETLNGTKRVQNVSGE